MDPTPLDGVIRSLSEALANPKVWSEKAILQSQVRDVLSSTTMSQVQVLSALAHAIIDRIAMLKDNREHVEKLRQATVRMMQSFPSSPQHNTPELNELLDAAIKTLGLVQALCDGTKTNKLLRAAVLKCFSARTSVAALEICAVQLDTCMGAALVSVSDPGSPSTTVISNDMVVTTFQQLLSKPEVWRNTTSFTNLTRNAVKNFLVSATFAAAQQAASALPFGMGTVAVALAKNTADRVQIMTENREQAQKLQKLTRTIASRGDGIKACFSSEADEAAIVAMEELFATTAEGFGLIHAVLDSKGIIKLVCKYLGCRTTVKALETVNGRLDDGVKSVLLALGDILARSRTESVKRRKIEGEQPYLKALRDAPAKDAVSFWEKYAKGETAVLGDLLDGLFTTCLRADLLPAEFANINPRRFQCLLEFFSGASGVELVSVATFDRFLGKAQSVAEAVRAFLLQAKAELATMSTPTSNPTVLSNAAADSARLRSLLLPLEAGPDLKKHQAVFAEGTREWVFDALETWVKLPLENKDRRVFWVQGTGGLGKSVIAGQIVKRYGVEKNGAPFKLSAYYFCKHDDAARNEPRWALVTLVFWLAMAVAEYKAILLQYFAEEEGGGVAAGRIDQGQDKTGQVKQSLVPLRELLAGTGSFEDLYAELLKRPLVKAMEQRAEKKITAEVFILVDALDELQEGSNRRTLLHLIGHELPKLPAAVRFIITSRPEHDIVWALDSLSPFKLQKQHEMQLEDMRIYAKAQIFSYTRLNKLPEKDAAELLDEFVKRADGVFLAISFIGRAVRELDADLDEGKKLGKADILAMLNSSSNLVDGSYTSTLDRIQERLRLASGEDAEQLAELQELFADIMAVLVASREPLRKCDVPRFCGGARDRNPNLIDQLLNPLSLLYSAVSETSTLEPLHKTVVDYLVEKDVKTGLWRAGAHHVDARRGHALLASAALRVLHEEKLLPSNAGSEPRLVEPSEIQGNVGAIYALKHGHMHLLECIKTLGAEEENVKGGREALTEWRRSFIVRRKNMAVENLPAGCELSPMMAASSCGAWLLLQAYSVGGARRPKFDAFAAVVSQGLKASGADVGLAAFFRIMTLIAQTFPHCWKNTADNDKAALQKGMAHFAGCVSVTSEFFQSGGLRYLFAVTGCKPQNTPVEPMVEMMDACAQTSRLICGFSHSVQVWDATAVQVWDATAHKLLHVVDTASTLKSLAIRGDGDLFVTGSDDFMARIWDTESGLLLRVLYCGASVACTSFEFGGNRLVTGSRNLVQVWDAITGQPIQELKSELGSVVKAAFDIPNGQIIAIVASHEQLQVLTWLPWAATPNNPWTIAEPQTHIGIRYTLEITGATLSAYSGRVVLDFTERFYTYSGSGETYHKIVVGPIFTVFDIELLWPVALSPDGRFVISRASSTGDARLWTGDALHSLFELKAGTVTACAFTTNGMQAVTANKQHKVRFWDVATGRQLYEVDLASAVLRRRSTWDVATGRQLYEVDLASAVLRKRSTFLQVQFDMCAELEDNLEGETSLEDTALWDQMITTTATAEVAGAGSASTGDAGSPTVFGANNNQTNGEPETVAAATGSALPIESMKPERPVSNQSTSTGGCCLLL